MAEPKKDDVEQQVDKLKKKAYEQSVKEDVEKGRARPLSRPHQRRKET